MDYYMPVSSADTKMPKELLAESTTPMIPADWPIPMVEANVWPNFLWRSHPDHNASTINQCVPIQVNILD
jgi:hypothetical protein